MKHTEQKSRIEKEVKLPATAREVWELIGEFNGVPAWHPMIVDSYLQDDGKVRRVTIADDGGENVEKLLSYDKSRMSYSYTMLEGPIPVRDYMATISVKNDLDDNAVVTWEAEFLADGASQEEAEKGVRTFLKSGMDSLKEIFK